MNGMKIQKTLGLFLVGLLAFTLSFSLALAKDNRNSDDLQSGNKDAQELEDIQNNNQNDGAEGDFDMGDRHEKIMKGILQDLNDISENDNEDNDVGDEIKDIADNEASSTERRMHAMQDIEHRNAFSKFLLGVDTEKINVLSSELDNTQKNITLLEEAKKKIASTTLQTKLDEQIKSLQDAKAAAEAFVKENESTFSLFGWFKNLFK